jgi:hypothetical protein
LWCLSSNRKKSRSQSGEEGRELAAAGGEAIIIIIIRLQEAHSETQQVLFTNVLCHVFIKIVPSNNNISFTKRFS